MALNGKLTDMSLADLIQLQCQAGAQSHLALERSGQRGDLYFAGGEIVHAQLGAASGAEAVYALLLWDEGNFIVEQNVSASQRSVELPWSALVLEGLRRKDEGPGEEPAAAVNPLQQALSEMTARSSFLGMLLVSRDGVALAAELPEALEPKRVGAIAAGLVSLSGRSAAQLARGELLQTLIQGSEGNIILTQAGPQAVLVALADSATTLGMAFLEARESAQSLAEHLKTTG